MLESYFKTTGKTLFTWYETLKNASSHFTALDLQHEQLCNVVLSHAKVVKTHASLFLSCYSFICYWWSPTHLACFTFTNLIKLWLLGFLWNNIWRVITFISFFYYVIILTMSQKNHFFPSNKQCFRVFKALLVFTFPGLVKINLSFTHPHLTWVILATVFLRKPSVDTESLFPLIFPCLCLVNSFLPQSESLRTEKTHRLMLEMSIKCMNFNNMIESRTTTFWPSSPLTVSKHSDKPLMDLGETQLQPKVSFTQI